MIKVNCFKCEKELKELGAIVLSPPSGDICFKFHLCQSCYINIKVTELPNNFCFAPRQVAPEQHQEETNYCECKQPMNLPENNWCLRCSRPVKDWEAPDVRCDCKQPTPVSKKIEEIVVKCSDPALGYCDTWMPKVINKLNEIIRHLNREAIK